MKTLKTTAALGAAVIACAAWAAPASAITFDVRNNDGCGAAGEPSCSNGNGNARQYTVDGVTVTAKAFADTNFELFGEDKIQTAHLGHFGGNGLGVENRDETGGSPGHSIDNAWHFDAVQLAFSSSVRLTDLFFGWDNGDTDFTVLYYTGAGSPTLVGERYSQLTPEWALLANYDSYDSGWKQLSNTTAFSQYWLVLAANDVFGNTYRDLGGDQPGIDEGDDYFKLGKFSAELPTEVPEPASLALFGLGLAGLGFARRRR